jgi:hypothetical protein
VPSPTISIGVLLWVLLVPGWAPASAQKSDAPRLAAIISLEKVLQGKKTAVVEAGGGVTLKLIAADGGWRQNLTILADGVKLTSLEGGRFMACARLAVGPVIYWAISEYTGGAHCCGEFAFLARAGAGQMVRFLGKTMGYNGGPRDFPGSFKQRRGQLYFESFDNRFDYFHASHADCLLVNVPQFYYHLTPTGLTVDNIAFKDVYLHEIAAVDREIDRQAGRRSSKPEAILKPGFSPGFNGMVFSDTLGQLLVKRTILYLYAREDRQAWSTFHREVKRYYRTAAWVPQLQQEIEQVMGKHPY